MKDRDWKMPEWMESYREHFCNTGGNSLEDLMQDEEVALWSNAMRFMLVACVDSQVTLLERLHKVGLLPAPALTQAEVDAVVAEEKAKGEA